MSLSGDTVSYWRTLVFGMALSAVTICAATEYWGMEKVAEVAAAFHHGDLAFALATEDMRDEVLQLRRFEKDVLLNVGAAAAVQSYQDKWDDAFLHLRYDLARARRSAPAQADPGLQTVVDSVGAYRSAFVLLCAQIQSGALSNAQQANLAANEFRQAARSAEQALTAISENALGRAQTVDPALVAQRWGLAVSLLVFFILTVLYISGHPRLRTTIGA